MIFLNLHSIGISAMDSLIQGASANDRAQCYLAAHNGARNFTDMFCEGAMRGFTQICEEARFFANLYNHPLDDQRAIIAGLASHNPEIRNLAVAMREPTHHRAICELAREWGALSYETAINDNVPDIA